MIISNVWERSIASDGLIRPRRCPSKGMHGRPSQARAKRHAQDRAGETRRPDRASGSARAGCRFGQKHARRRSVERTAADERQRSELKASPMLPGAITAARGSSVTGPRDAPREGGARALSRVSHREPSARVLHRRQCTTAPTAVHQPARASGQARKSTLAGLARIVISSPAAGFRLVRAPELRRVDHPGMSPAAPPLGELYR